MKQTITVKHLLLSALATFGLAASLAAQPAPLTPTFQTATTPAVYGLLGQNYASLDFAYINHKNGPPRLLHSYGILHNTAISPGFDTGLKYHYTTGHEFGQGYRHHEALASATAYVPLSWARPFIEGNAGWVWSRVGAAKDNGFAYRVTGGLELGSLTPFALTPFVSYEDTPHYRERLWSYGAKATVHITEGWSATVGANIDEKDTVEYRLAVNLHL